MELKKLNNISYMSAVIPSMVDKEELLDANSINSLVMNIGNILTPIIAAFLYGTFGMKIILIVNSLSFCFSAISEMFINIPKNHKSPEKINFSSFKRDLLEGIKIIKSNKLISTMISLGTMINFSVAPLFSIGLIYIVKEVLKANDLQFGVFQMVLSASMLAAPILCGGIMKKIKVGRLSYLSFTTISILIFIMALIPSSTFINAFRTNMVPIIGLMIISFLVGMAATIVNIGLGTLFSQVVPLDLMGRTSTVFNLAVTVFIPIGQMIFGVLYDIIIPTVAVALSGLLLIVITKKYKNALLSCDEVEEKQGHSIGDVINEV
ncbi:MAG: MFS transporter [Tissierellia bacterium]|nr:MFS transporter [Tissierellia bacterium]